MAHVGLCWPSTSGVVAVAVAVADMESNAGCHTTLIAAVGPSFFLYSPHQLAAGQYPPQSSRTSHLLYSTFCYANANAMQGKTEAITPAK
ncbi:hypothetical protein SLA2020_056430 [Shorea laevis]